MSSDAHTAEGLIATLVDSDNAPSFDSTRDATGCEVLDQEPVAGEMLAVGEEVSIVVSCAQVDWDNREGSSWDEFSAAYSMGFDDGCQALFDQSPDGSMYEDGYEYTVTDCRGENPGDGSEASEVPSEVPDDPEAAGLEAGALDGCTALFENQSVWSLNHGQHSWTQDDCPIDGIPAAPADEAPRADRPSSLKAAGESCRAQESDGTPVTLMVDRGIVNCAGAEALWNEYLRRAPNEGVGSGAAVELDGWGCIAASAAQSPRVGSCVADDRSGAFTVYEGE